MMEVDENMGEKTNLIRALSESETNQFLDYCKDLFLNSIDDKRKNDPNSEELYEKIKKLSYVHNKIDPKCILRINKRLVRIEYPGEVKNIEKAIQTLGGIESIEAAVADQKKNLELRFHPNNRFNKPCLAEKDFKPGILIKVKPNHPQPGSSKDLDSTIQEEFSYTIEGISVINFVFNRLCDFQYLPLVAEQQPETKSSKTEFIYDKLMPNKISDMEWFNKDELKNMEPFLLPVRFSRYDNSNVKLNLDNNDKCDDIKESNIQSKTVAKKRKLCKIFGKKQQISIFVTFKDKEIPKKPLDSTVKLATSRSLDEQIARVKQLFEQRPIWTKSAIIYNTGITIEHSKIILPMVAYYFTNGPWRISWVKYGYDPRLDPEARIYQTLDYRIRTVDSTKLKVNAKRTYSSKTLSLGPNHVKKISLKDDITTKQRLEIDERCYVLRPSTIPPARQMFYQLCDLILPEIQDKISHLPPPPHSSSAVCDSKIGWLPKRFIEECREIVNHYVLDAVQKELFKDKKMIQEKVTKQQQQQSKCVKDKPSSLDYCNQMLNNIKKGIYKNVDIRLSGPSFKDKDLENLGGDIEMIDLSDDDDDEDDYDELTVDEIIQNSIPETMENVREDDEDVDVDDDDDDQMLEEDEIDMETVEEINKIIMGEK